ncbi:MAG: hypothetical protein KGS72_11705 [Cyanobacteria bacterium REEB67]|nr:hypothetical protein [Cyanobacteria bacterium REEB67]
MRCDQYIGLNEWARQKVSLSHVVREVGARILPSGRAVPFDRTMSVPLATKEVVGKITGAWTDHVANLHRYTFPDGRVYEEFIQAEPWSGGPCYYIALKNLKGNVIRQSLWTSEELC